MSGRRETTSEPAGEPRGTVSEPAGVARGPLHAWIGRRRSPLIACAILVVGIGLSLGGALLWRSSVRSRERQQFQTNATDVEVVPARELAAFQARRAADPAFRKFVGGTIVPVAPSGRAVYCLLSAGGTVTPYTKEVGQLLQGDWCNPATPIGGFADGGITQAALVQSITDSGQ